MADPVTTGPDDAMAALKELLAPGGIPSVGTLQAVYDRSPEVPYAGPTPALFLYPQEYDDEFVTAGQRQQMGWLAATYLDSTPSQQQTTLAVVEDAMWANHKALVARIRSDLTWGGNVSLGGRSLKARFDPQGPLSDEAGMLWTRFLLLISYKGPLERVRQPG